MMGKLLVGFIAFSFLPIFRGAGHSRHDGVNFWRLAYDSSRGLKEGPFGHEHNTYEEAVNQTKAALQQIFS